MEYAKYHHSDSATLAVTEMYAVLSTTLRPEVDDVELLESVQYYISQDMATKAEKDMLEYKGGYTASRFDGPGTYESAHGGKYVGDFVDGLYHGEGILYVKNGYFKGEWEDGRLAEGKFYFTDSLEYTAPPESWEYCDGDEDRRFYSEIKDGKAMAICVLAYKDKYVYDKGVEQNEFKYVSATHCPSLPTGCYDVDEGYYDPDSKAIFDFKTKDVVRYPKSEEVEWIVTHCRKGK